MASGRSKTAPRLQPTLAHFRFSLGSPTLPTPKHQDTMTLSRQFEVDAARFRKELLFVCCKSDDPTVDRMRQLHDVLPSPTDKMLSPVSRALKARSSKGKHHRLSAA